MRASPKILETQCEWSSDDVAESNTWIHTLSPRELDEIDAALNHSLGRSEDILEVGREDFPLPTVCQRLRGIEAELINGRGFALLRGVPREKYSQSEMEMIYWGIGLHLGDPWPQNQYGHVLGDVTDQGVSGRDHNSRGNEIGAVAFPYHSDGSDLVGLLCLQKARSGGISTVANAVAIHNDLVREAPELAASLYRPQPFDFRNAEPPGGDPWYTMPVFTQWGDRLFVRYIRPYILASQRHAEAPPITDDAEAAMQRVDAMTKEPRYNVFMDLQPGDMQFINNYHVLHARTAYQDDRETGQIRHLKRLWLATNVLEDRPPYFRRNPSSHWGKERTVSRLTVD